MCHKGSEQASGPCADCRKQEAYDKSGNQTPSSLVQVGEGKNRRRANDSCDDRAARPGLEDELNKAAIDDFFANCDARNERKECKTFDIVLRENFERQLREDAAYFSRVGGDAAQTKNLVQKYQGGKHNGGPDGDWRIGNREAELCDTDSARARAPKNDACSKPLKCDRGSVQAQAVHLRCLRHCEQLADAPAYKPGNGEGEKNQDEREVPGHGDR